MNKLQKQVRDFHIAMGLEWNDKPDMLTSKAAQRRIALMEEELGEFYNGFTNRNMLEMIDAIADLLYVVLGTAVELGVDIEPFFDEVHRSNMTKVGGHKRDDGKWIKPDDYSPANLSLIWYYMYGERYENN